MYFVAEKSAANHSYRPLTQSCKVWRHVIYISQKPVKASSKQGFSFIIVAGLLLIRLVQIINLTSKT